MYEQTFGIVDIAVTAIIVGGAGFYLYRKIFKKKSVCGGGCDSCASAPKKNRS
ncbi:FeoB-associated Cys-rich membrane protein [Vibrio sp. HN007]|uniref:FeoB-associated Cys-rich membrane protein n=1 Tax=Vibrio iocasae TaxID=3098914 RepID=UPI0035D4EAF3